MIEPIEYVPLNLNASAPLGSKIFVPARIDKLMRGEEVPHYRLRIYSIHSHQQMAPSLIRKWMLEDYRYKAWFSDAPVPYVVEAHSVEAPTPIEEESFVEESPSIEEESLLEDFEDVVEAQAVNDDGSRFDYWTVEDIEDAILSGADGLLAYADYKGIDLGDAKLKGDVLDRILEWYDANLG